MARRKGSGRGKSTVNSRKSALENAREKLRDDPGGTKAQQQQLDSNLSNMEATATTQTAAAATTAKYYNKTKLQNNNHQQQRSLNEQQNKATTTTTTNNKKTQQTYRELEETQLGETTQQPQKKLTAKQAKAAAKLAAQQQQQQQQNAKNGSNVQQQQQQKESSKKMKQEEEAKLNSTSMPATTKVTTTANNASNTITTNQRSTTATITTNSSSSSNINNNNISSSNKSSNIHTSDNSLLNSISDQQQLMQKPHQQQQQQQLQNSNSDNLFNKTQEQQLQQQQQMSDNTQSSAMAWNNSKYLHKKFKRLASTTENDVLQEAEKLRTTSLSSASSSISSPPPIPTIQQQLQQHQHQPAPLAIKEDHLTNGFVNKYNNSRIQAIEQQPYNNNVQNQVLQQLAQQQQPQPQQQQHVLLRLNSGEIINNSVAGASATPLSSTIITTTTTASSSTAGGGGRNICPYCNLSCTKPSVLQKHIRAHTNERPYPCEICGIAFKTKSNLYKHCRSRSHAARQKGIEVPPDADDGLSDQDGDPELSNSSSEMLSRTCSPMDEIGNTSLPQQHQQIMQHNDSHVLVTSPLVNAPLASPMTSTSPASLSDLNSAYIQQPTQQQSQHLSLGSPAAGTLPPATVTTACNNSTSTTVHNKQAIDYKPYKPKFHNASLYATAKEAAAAAAIVIQPTQLYQKEVITIQKIPESHPSMNHHQQQHLIINDQKIGAASTVQQHLPPHQSPTHMPQHPTLSPSTQMKLNNHISTHQMQQLQQQQLQQLQSQAPQHLLRSSQANAMPLPLAAAAYYLGQPPPGSPAALLHPSAHIPAQPFYNPVAAAVAQQQAFASLHMMTPQQQQQFQHQLQLQQQHLQHQQQMQLQQHSSVAPPSSTHSQPTAPPPSQGHIKPPTPVANPNQGGSAQSSNSRQIVQHTKHSTPSNTTIVHPTPQNPLHYLASAASVASALNPPPPSQPLNNKNSIAEMPEQNATVISHRSGHVCNNSSNLLQTNSANSGMQEVTLNKEKLHEHINKIISQNEAIVENKELLLQKKYPKTLNRSRSFTNNATNSSSPNSSCNTQVLQTTTGGPPSESATNAKLAQAIVQKQQMQQQQQQQLQQQQQQYLYQQQQHQQQQHQQQQQQQQYQQQLQKQRHIYPEKCTDEAPLPLNGLSKHAINKHLQQPNHNQPVPPSTNQAQYHQYRSIVTNTPSQPPSTNHQANPSITNVPLNLSAKSKSMEDRLDLSKASQGPLAQAPPPATPRKRYSIEQPQSQMLTAAVATVNETSNSSNSNCTTPQPSTSLGKYPANNSIIKNLLLNARGLAVPMGEGEDAVYICPLCLMEFRTAEDLQLHNSTYCQGSNSSANSPASSPSHKYFRSNSMSLNMQDLKILSKNPLSLVKLAWSQLKTKPSNLVLNRLSASVANTSKNSSTTTTTVASAQPSSTQTSSPTAACTSSVASQPKAQLSVNEIPLRFVDAPLPSPGPLLGKTALVDYTPNDSKYKSEEVIITKMHDDRMYNQAHLQEHSASKRLKFEHGDKISSKRSTHTSGGDMQPLNAQELSKKEERFKRFTSSGGCMIPLSECDDVDKSPKMIRTPLLSGGSFQEVSPKKDIKLPMPLMPGSQMTQKINLGLGTSNTPQHFQFPPINQITAFNPLTLGLTEKVIPYVPGIPGPNSLQPQLPPPIPQQQLLNLPQSPIHMSRTSSPNRKQTVSPMNMSSLQGENTDNGTSKALATFGGVQNVPSEFTRVPPSTNMRNVRNWQTAVNSLPSNKSSLATEATKSLKSFNFMRIADNLSPRKNSMGNDNKPLTLSQSEAETRHFNLDKMSREQLIIHQPVTITKSLSPTSITLTPLHIDTNAVAIENEIPSLENTAKSKFLRPTSLPLRPGTFTPKRHHGITPTANTLPLISPETPRPSKECVQLYLNGNSYTYLGLKSSTKTFYCTLNCPQPSYVQDMHKLSMYSMWQQCAENNPHPLGLKPKEVMSLYDSRQKVLIFAMAESKKLSFNLVTAQQIVMTPFFSSEDKFYHHQLKQIALEETSAFKDNADNKESKDNSRDVLGAYSSASSQTLVGGYESHENYTYIRGRGRGKYVCSECGIRCKKPSMLKKHIRTHTDVRPYTCKHCNFSFKTKGNLTKHMQSKTHYKKCIELGLNPGPMPADGEFLEPDVEFDQQSSTSAGGRTSSMGNAESDTDGDSSGNETESSNESDSARSNVAPNLNTSAAEENHNKSRLEHEAARCLLTLSMTPPIHTQSLENSIANSQIAITTVCSSSIVSTAPVAAIRRVISYTSPKPPFDYHKQEQYYSNPEESKPKLPNTAATFESAPMDLTKPRYAEPLTTPAVSSPSPAVTNHSSLSSNPGPVQTQAQIRDVIFGVNKNESGFFKTMISVSSKVGRNFLDNYEENHHKQNEDMMLYDYRREQTLQYYKIKQTQLNRGMSANPNMMSSGTPTSNTICTTTISQASLVANTTVILSSAVVSSVVSSSLPQTQQSVTKKEVTTLQLPKIEIIEPVENHKLEITEIKALDKPKSVKSLKSSDESEETDEEPPSKKMLTPQDDKPAHNANLPAAILQPGTTDFSGVLSGGGSNQSNSSNPPTRTVIVGEDGFTTNNEILPVHPRIPQTTNADGRPVCSICSKTFQKQSQLVLHMNIHYMERKYKCDPCGVSFRAQGHLQKHERSEAHKNKVIMTSTFGVPTTSNPRPFECTDCKIAFRIHGHLAKHLRSKTHVQKLECLQKLPFGTYAEIERAGISLTEIDTSDCENSLISLRVLAQKLIEKDPSSKLGTYTTPSGDNSNTGLVSQDSASEDGFTAAERAAASAIASLDNNSAANTPRRTNSTSEDESIALALNNNLKRRLPGTFSNGEESDKELQEQQQEKRPRQDIPANISHMSTANPTN